MTHQAVVFLAFANSSTAPLEKLSEEDDALYKILQERSVKEGHFHIHRESHLDLNSLRYYLTEYKNQIYIFHYAGHADSQELFLSDGEAHAGGLAEMLAEQENLQLVFLNGCSSKGQVEYLLELGIPAVIATRCSIDDNMAMNFAKHFYHALELGAHIEKAFNHAAAFARASGKETQVFRKFQFKGPGHEDVSDKEIWSLYSRSDRENALRYTLPRGGNYFSEEDYEPNEELLKRLWNTLLNEGIVLQKRKIKPSRKRMAILNNFPAPIAENLRKLLVPLGDEEEGYDVIGLPRIKQLAKTYQVLFEFLSFTLLAQLWEAKYKDVKLQLNQELQAKIRNFLYQSIEDRKKFKFLPFIHLLLNLLEETEVKYFVEELKALSLLSDEGSPYKKACEYFDLLRDRIHAEEILPVNYIEECKRAEEALAELFSEHGYLTRYTLATIKNIDVQKFRHTPEASFKHVVIRLIDLLGGMEEEDETLDRFLDNQSVLLLKENEDEDITGFLNLSPFIIDENAFVDRSDKSKIYFLNHYESQAKSWCYEYVHEPDDPHLRVPGRAFKIIQEQFDAFVDIFLNGSGV
ncbi:MAG: CHAT domain-containing protein [Bacteroidota bacterium]